MSTAPLGHRAPLAWLLLPLLLGLTAAKLSPVALPVPLLLGAAWASLGLAAALAARHATGWALALWAGLLGVGAAYYELRRARLPEWDALPPREARLTLKVVRVFQSAQPGRFSGLGWVEEAEPHLRELVGQQVALSLPRVPADTRPGRGSRVEAIGLLEPLPRRPRDDPFLEYLGHRGVNFRLSRGRLLAHQPATGPYARGREHVRQRASERLGLGLHRHPDLAAALRGMLLGERHALDEAQEHLYLRLGAMHLFAISGLHIGVIAGGLIALLRLARLRPFLVFVLGSGLLWFYVDMTGALPSAVRAWLMVVCLHGSHVLRAPGNPLSAFALSALLVLLLDPMQLFGAGFQMSYAIVAALLLYGLPLRAHWMSRIVPWRNLPPGAWCWWHRASRRASDHGVGAVAISVAATSIGMASGIAFFQLFTPLAIVVNVLLIPLATGAILAGFLSLVTGVVGATAAGLLFNHAAALILWMMQKILEALAALPFASAPACFDPSWLGPATIAVLVGGMVAGYARHWRVPGGYWLPPLLLATLLVLGVRFI